MKAGRKWLIIPIAVALCALVVWRTWHYLRRSASGPGAAAIPGKCFEEEALSVRAQNGAVLWQGTLRRFRLKAFNSRGHGFPFIFSPNLARFAYPSGESYGGHMHRVIIDGEESRKCDEVGQIVFSPDSRRVAYDAAERDKHFLVLDGQKGPLYDDDILTIVFSPDSRRIAHTAGREYNDVVVLDGKVVGSHDYVNSNSLLFSPDSRRFAYCARDGEKAAVYLDGKKLDSFDEYRSWSLRFSHDSRRISYVFRRGRHWFLKFGQKAYGPYDKVDGIFQEISADSREIAFPAKRGKNWFLICGQREYGPSPWSPRPVFAPVGRTLAYIASHEGKAGVFLAGKLLGSFDRVGQAEFSPDGKHFAFVADKGDKSLLIVDGKTVKEADRFEFTYSPDAKHLAAIVRQDEKDYVCLDGRDGKRYDDICIGTVHFSPDSQHLAYWAEEGERVVLVIDGTEALSFQGCAEWLSFSDGNRLRGVVFTGTSPQNAAISLLELTPRRQAQ